MTVSRTTRLYNTDQGIAQALADGPTPYAFITTGGYVPDPAGTPCGDEVKGKCFFDMFPSGPPQPNQGNAVQINVNGAPVDARGLYLKLYTAYDDTEPWFQHTGPVNAGTYRCRRTFQLGSVEVIEEWQETWT